MRISFVSLFGIFSGLVVFLFISQIFSLTSLMILKPAWIAISWLYSMWLGHIALTEKWQLVMIYPCSCDNVIHHYMFKAQDGLSLYYFHNWEQNLKAIIIKPAGREAVFQNCIRCHSLILWTTMPKIASAGIVIEKFPTEESVLFLRHLTESPNNKKYDSWLVTVIMEKLE